MTLKPLYGLVLVFVISGLTLMKFIPTFHTNNKGSVDQPTRQVIDQEAV